MLFTLLYRQIKYIRVDIGRSLDEFQMNGVVKVKFNGRRNSLESTPEEFSCFLEDMISRESRQ
jgi:hypothetical protein